MHDAGAKFTGRYKAGEKAPLHLGGEAESWRLGEYRIVRLLGEGAMGKVYEAIQESLQRRVALKVLPDDFAKDEDAVQRFEREARSCGNLVHPHIVPVYQFGVDQGRHFYAMEYVTGRSLRDLLKDEKAPLKDEKKIAKYILHAAFALDYAHKQGVIHRDVKPDNILIREDDQACLSDFGLARKRDAKAITQAGALMGTPTYMAPEQAMGQAIDGRIDIYALGVTLWECLAGKLPFFSNSLRELLVQITQLPPPSLRAVRPDVSDDLESIALKCMAKEPAERYQTGKELADDIIRFFRGDVAHARQASALQIFLRKVKKHPAVATLAALLVVVVVGGAIGSRAMSRAKATTQAEGRLAEASGLVEAPMRRWTSSTAELAAAREQRDREQRPDADGPVQRALASLREAERALLDRTADADAPASRALELLREALVVAPEGSAARDEARRLARTLVLAQRARAEREGDRALAASSVRELQALGALDVTREVRPRRLSVTTEPPGARVVLRPVTFDDAGAWTLGTSRDLGSAPVTGVELAPGGYALDVDLANHAPVRLPIVVAEASLDGPGAPAGGSEGRAPAGARVEGAPAGGGEGRAPGARVEDDGLSLLLRLPASDRVPADLVWIAPGEVVAGGDALAVRPLVARREPAWTAGFFIGKHEVSVREWVEFVASLPAAERGAHLSSPFQLGPGGATARAGHEDEPVVGVRLESARAYCRWRTARHGAGRFRLPTDLEWEKAGRGPFALGFPWGDQFDPAAARLHLGAIEGRPNLAPRGSGPRDRSIYEVHDLAGSVSEWVDGRFEGDPRLGVLRGGSWARGPEVTRLCSREPVDPEDTAEMLRVRDRVGLRVAWDRE